MILDLDEIEYDHAETDFESWVNQDRVVLRTTSKQLDVSQLHVLLLTYCLSFTYLNDPRRLFLTVLSR